MATSSILGRISGRRALALAWICVFSAFAIVAIATALFGDPHAADPFVRLSIVRAPQHAGAPSPTAANPQAPPLVWAVDTRHAPMFWFPRDFPRGCIWPVTATTPADRERFFGQSAATRIHVMEAGWLPRMQACRLYAYRLPAEVFRPHEVGGYWVAGEPVEAIEQVIVDDLVDRHAAARIELRISPSIWPFWRRVADSTVEFSGSRLGNSAPYRPPY